MLPADYQEEYRRLKKEKPAGMQASINELINNSVPRAKQEKDGYKVKLRTRIPIFTQRITSSDKTSETQSGRPVLLFDDD